MDFLYAALFTGFLGLGVAVRLAKPSDRRRRILGLIAYVVVVHLAAGLSQRDAWPFTCHTIAAGRVKPDARACLIELAGVDASGREWRLDPYSWMPVYGSVLQSWCGQRLAGLTGDERTSALSFLLLRAEESRGRLAAGRGIGPARWLGPLGAPYWWLLPRPPVAPEPFVGLRAYTECWIPRERFAFPERRERTLLAEHLEDRR